MKLVQLIHRGARAIRRRCGWFAIGLGLVLLLGLALVQRHTERRRVQAAIRSQLDAIRAAGQPVTGRELWALYPNPSPKRNWRTTIEPLLQTNHLQVLAWQQFLTNPLSTSVLTALGLDVASNAPVVDVVMRTDLSGMEWRGAEPAEPDVVTSHGLPDGGQSINLILALGEKAAYATATGHPDQAATALVRSFEIAHVRSRFVIGAVGQLAGERCALQGLEMTLKRGAFTEADLRRIEGALSRRQTNLLHDALVEERVLGIWACGWARDHPPGAAEAIQTERMVNSIYGGGASGGRDGLGKIWTDVRMLLTGWGAQLNSDRDLLALLGRYDRLERATLLLPRDRASVFRQVDTERKALDPQKTSRPVLLVELRWGGLPASDAENQSRLAAARAALAVERWRLKHPGSLPADLNELVPDYLPAAPVDPYDGQPLRLKRLTRGFTLYQAGVDSSPTNRVDSAGYGVTFSIER